MRKEFKDGGEREWKEGKEGVGRKGDHIRTTVNPSSRTHADAASHSGVTQRSGCIDTRERWPSWAQDVRNHTFYIVLPHPALFSQLPSHVLLGKAARPQAFEGSGSALLLPLCPNFAEASSLRCGGAVRTWALRELGLWPLSPDHREVWAPLLSCWPGLRPHTWFRRRAGADVLGDGAGGERAAPFTAGRACLGGLGAVQRALFSWTLEHRFSSRTCA